MARWPHLHPRGAGLARVPAKETGMRFVGKAWRVLVGIKDGLVLIFMLMFFAGLYAALSVSPHRGSASRGALRLDLAGAIVEQPSVQSPLEAFGGRSSAREY